MKISFITTIENLLNPFEILYELNCIPLALCTEGLLFIGGERSTVPYNQWRCAFILGRALIMALEFNSTLSTMWFGWNWSSLSIHEGDGSIFVVYLTKKKCFLDRRK
jgi:hypothetical protein